jgi:hypothetical protein
MILLNKPLSEREPLEVLELNFYRLRLQDDNLVRTIEKIQAAAVSIVSELEATGATGPGSLHLTAASNSLLQAHKLLAQEHGENEATLNGLASFLKMNDVELFESMEELTLAQEFLE